MADLYVTSAASSGDGSFSAIVSSSVNKDKIYFDDTIFTDGKVVITSSNNTISGKDNFFIVDNDKEVTFDSQQANRFLTVTNGSVAEFNNSGFTNGKITGNGGAIQVTGKAVLRGSNVKFANNSSTNVGGAAYIGSAGATFSNASFLNNSSSMGGALYAECAITIADSYFSGNSATYNGAAGGAIQFAGAGNSVITKTYFTGNSGKNGGTIAVNNASANVTFTGSTFKENTATNVGGAFYINKGTVNINNTLFDGNIKGALYLESAGVANINGATFAKASDTITNYGTLTFSGDILLGAEITNLGTITVSDAKFTFINSSALNILNLDKSGITGVTFANKGQVNFSSWDMSDAAISIDADILPFGGEVTLATGLTLANGQTVEVNGTDVALNSTFANGDYKLTYASGTLGVQALFAAVTSAAATGAGSLSAAYGEKSSTIRFADDLFTDGKATIAGGDTLLSAIPEVTVAAGINREVIIDAQNSNRCVSLKNSSVVNYENISFTNGQVTGNGGAIQVTEQAVLRGSNVKFANNSSTNVGGAAYIGSAGATFSNASFLNNSSSMGGALYAECAITIADSYFSGNSATYNGAAGGAIQFAGAGNSVITKTYFTGSSGKNGGTIAVNNASANVTFTGSTFKENTATNVGGAFYINQGTVNVNDTLFDGNIKGALYLESTGVANINGATFAKASDTITNYGTLTFSGDILLGAAVSGKGSYTVSGASFTFINSGTVSIADMGDETTIAGVNFNGGQVNFSAWDLSNVDIAVNAALPASGSVTLATGLTLDAEQKVKVNGADVALNSVFGNGVYQLNYASGTLSISVEALAVTSAEVSGEGSLSAILDAAGTTDMQKIVFADALFTDGKATLSAAESLLTAFADGLTLAAGTDREVILDAAGAGRIAAIASNSTVNYENVSFANGSANGENISGGAVYINAATVSFAGSEFTGNKAKSNGGAVWVTNHTSSAVKAAAQLTDVTFTGNESGNVGGALYVQRGSAIVTNGYFSGNKSKSGGAIYVDSEAAVTVNGAEFATATDTVYNAGTLTFSGNITLNAALGGDGTYVIAKDTVFTNAVDLSNINISVDGSLYQDKAVTIATGVSAIGKYTTGVENLYLTVENGALILRTANVTADVTTFAGTGSNLMTNGEVVTFFADKSGADNIATTILGGKVESNLVGGAYVAAGKTAAVDKVELNIGDAEVAAKVYAGGYLYGDKNADKAAAEAQLTVKSVNITIDGGAVSTNMYGGAHARQFGNASVTEVNITVTAGNHGRIYAGGWAEKGAVSSVGIANVIISGGTVDYLYGGGANADGKTYVTTTNITVSDAAVVNTIFMGGRYGYSWVDNVNLTFAGADKVLNRLSGVSSAGMDYAKATVVELETNVTADLIDYVDKFVINEGYTLTANNEFYLGNRLENGETDGFTTFDFIAEGEAEWTAVAGISDFTNAQFSVNGAGLTTWDGKSAIAIDGYSLTYNAEDKTIKLAQITA